MTMYELVIIWENGDKEVFDYDTENEAEKAGRGMQKAFGRQISWWGTRRSNKDCEVRA